MDEAIVRAPPVSLPGFMILAAGGAVGGSALVTVIPMGTLTLLPPFFLRIIFKCVGVVMLRKY